MVSFGWYNIDVALKEGPNNIPTNVKVTVTDNYKNNVELQLVIPELKCNQAGAFLNNVFTWNDGEDLHLPNGTLGYIIAIGEKDKQFLYGKALFKAGQKETLTIDIKPTTTLQLNADIQNMGWQGLQIKAQENKQQYKLDSIQQQINAIKNMQPKQGCDCGGSLFAYTSTPAASSTATDYQLLIDNVDVEWDDDEASKPPKKIRVKKPSSKPNDGSDY